MKTFVVELYFACDSATTMGELDEIPRLDSYRAETVLTKLTEETLDDARLAAARQFPGVRYLHVLDVRNHEGEQSSEHERFTAIDNINDTEIRKSSIHGYGLFAKKNVHPKTRLAILDGQVVHFEVNKKMAGFTEWNALEGNRILVRPFRTKYSFINHSRNPNAELRRLSEDETAGGNRIEIVSRREIKPEEEITLDYRCEPLPEKYLSEKGEAYL